MNFDNNHFIDAGNHISGLLYGMKRHYDSRYDGKANKQPSTYSEEVYGYGWSSKGQHPSAQRSNGLVEGSGKPVASGILIGGVDFAATSPLRYEAKGSDDTGEHTIQLNRTIGGWSHFMPCPCGKGVPPSKSKPFSVALRDALWIISGKLLPYGSDLDHLA